MKRNVFISVLLSSLFFCTLPPKLADSLPDNERMIDYVVDISVPKDTACIKASQWLALAAKSAKKIIEMQDCQNGIIIAKPLWTFSKAVDPLQTSFWRGAIEYTLTIKIKEGKIKMSYEIGTISNADPAWMEGKYPTDTLKSELIQHFKKLKEDCISAINKKDDF